MEEIFIECRLKVIIHDAITAYALKQNTQFLSIAFLAIMFYIHCPIHIFVPSNKLFFNSLFN